MRENLELTSLDTSKALVDEFLTVTLAISTLCKKYGMHRLEAHSQTGIQRYTSLPIEVKEKILQGCHQFLGFSDYAEKEGIDLRHNNVQLTWLALRQLGLRPHSDLFNHLTDEHIVEIYNENSIQIYRSFNLFQYLSYSISDIFCHEWWELYTRDTEVYDQMLDMNNKLLDGSVEGVVKTTFPDHWVQEIFSPQCLRSTMRHELCSPLTDKNKKNMGFISAFKIIDSKSTLPI